MSRASKKFDEQLFNLKLSGELSGLPVNFVDALNRALLESHETGADWSPMYFVDHQLALLRHRRVVEADRIGREVWQIHQGESVTPEFVREILVPEAMEQIGVIEGYITDARATGDVTWEPAWAYLASELGKLKSETVNRYAREIKALELANQGESSVAQNIIGRNIDRLKTECGWSLDVLADKTGIDKKLVHSHVHGKHKPNPKTLKEYAQAFTKQLGRQITANNLKE
jgi:hypothetical protein